MEESASSVTRCSCPEVYLLLHDAYISVLRHLSTFNCCSSCKLSQLYQMEFDSEQVTTEECG